MEKDFVYDESTHSATFKGKPIPSITQLVALRFPIPKSIKKEVLENASDRGTFIHKDIENTCVDILYDPQTQEGKNFKKLITTYNLLPICNEVLVFVHDDNGNIVAYGHIDGIFQCGSYVYFDTSNTLRVEAEPSFTGGEKIIYSVGDYILYDNKTVAKFENDKVALQENLYRLADLSYPVKHNAGIWVRDDKVQLRPLPSENVKGLFLELLAEWHEIND